VPSHDVLLGVTGESPQFGVLAKVMGRTVALDLNQTHTISLFGVQGGGKSYTLGSIIEMASLPLSGINCLPQPLATVVFHYSQTQDYKPEFTSMIRPNDDAQAVATLAADYQARPAALKDIVLLAPSAKLDARRAEYPGIEVLPLKFASAELQASHWRFLMGAVGNQATYKYISNPDLVEGLVSVVREMRHKGTSILVASQDPPSVPVALIELSSQIILHRFNSPAWLKHIQKANAALLNLTPEQLTRLQPGEAFVWSSKATDALFFREAVKLKLRPRATLHGGVTKTAV
jgi:hypothetical protein